MIPQPKPIQPFLVTLFHRKQSGALHEVMFCRALLLAQRAPIDGFTRHSAVLWPGAGWLVAAVDTHGPRSFLISVYYARSRVAVFRGAALAADDVFTTVAGSCLCLCAYALQRIFHPIFEGVARLTRDDTGSHCGGQSGKTTS